MHWFLTFSVYECVLAIGGHSGSPDGWNSKGFSMLIQQPSTCSYTPVTLKPSPGPKSTQSFPIPVSSTHGSRLCDFPPPWLPQGNSRPGGYSHSSGFQRGQPPPPTVSSAGAAALWPLRTELPAPLVVSLSHCTSAFLWTGASTLQERLVDGREGLAESPILCLCHERQADRALKHHSTVHLQHRF